MYERSMIGSGAAVYAVWGYVIATMKPDKAVGMQVTLNPALLAVVIGEKESVMQSAIDYLCAPDARSTTPDEGGRRLVKLGMFDYRVVNGAKYTKIRSEEERREYNRTRQANLRAKRGVPLPGETAYVRAIKAGASAEELERMS